MKRRELLSAAMLVAAAARAQDGGTAKGWPAEEKLSKTKREISEAMAKVRLDNADGPDLLPRARRRSK
ncbi:MAG: hypothetical protein ABR567_05325 [Myxococcales bacterium]|nr:hypothetical protein [Myxococcales bacterium]